VNPIKTLNVKLKGIKIIRDRIPNKVLKEIFPKKFKRGGVPEELYAHLKKLILSGKLKKGQKLTHEGITEHFNKNRSDGQKVISQLKEDGLIISKGRKGSFVADLSNKGR
jgi:DNA-binding GntR family transcriptional regulator